MKFDAYTKIILTVIAVCLLWICLDDAQLVTPAEASVYRTELTRVEVWVCNDNGTDCQPAQRLP